MKTETWLYDHWQDHSTRYNYLDKDVEALVLYTRALEAKFALKPDERWIKERLVIEHGTHALGAECEALIVEAVGQDKAPAIIAKLSAYQTSSWQRVES